MCDLCDDPELTLDASVQHVRDQLTRRRYVVHSAAGSRTRAECTYSIGLTAHGLPELVVTGVRSADAGQLVALCGDYLLDHSLVLPGETLESGPFVMEAVEVSRPEEHLVLAVALYGSAVRALQLAWADERGRWPWESGHRSRSAGQPLLGQRAPESCDDHRLDRLDVPPHP